MMMIDNEIAAALMSVPAVAYLTVIECWRQDGNDVSFLYPGPLKPLLERRLLDRVFANSIGYFGSDFACKSVYRYMDYDAELYRPFVLLTDTRCMCTDTESD